MVASAMNGAKTSSASHATATLRSAISIASAGARKYHSNAAATPRCAANLSEVARPRRSSANETAASTAAAATGSQTSRAPSATDMPMPASTARPPGTRHRALVKRAGIRLVENGIAKRGQQQPYDGERNPEGEER